MKRGNKVIYIRRSDENDVGVHAEITDDKDSAAKDWTLVCLCTYEGQVVMTYASVSHINFVIEENLS